MTAESGRTLVTGASGYLGAAVARALIERGDHVTTLQRRPSGVDGVRDVRGDLTDAVARKAALAGVDAVVHLAARVSTTGSPADFRAINVDATAAIVAEARAAGVRRFVQVSSPSVAHVGRPIAGDGAGAPDPDRARSEYARSKAAGELVALAADAPGFAVVAVRPHLVWGPGDPQLVGRIRQRAAAGRLPVVGTGAALVDSCYIDDAVSGILAALAAAEHAHGAAYVLTSGEPRPVGELIAALCMTGGIAAPRRHVPAVLARAAGALVEGVWRIRPGDDEPPMTRFLAEQLSTAHWFDQRRTREAFGWAPPIGVARGLELLAAAS